jgi:hypothetical protein
VHVTRKRVKPDSLVHFDMKDPAGPMTFGRQSDSPFGRQSDSPFGSGPDEQGGPARMSRAARPG